MSTARRAEPDEIAVLARVHEAQLKLFQANAEAAKQLLSYGDSKRNEQLDLSELAAFTMVANVIMNLDETITKE
jgi:hypothetical protein